MTSPVKLTVNAQIAIPRRELKFSFVRSAGPGGQNVNKVASKAVLHWAVAASPSLSDEVKQRLLVSCARRINHRGQLVIASQRFRDQAKNVQDCLDKLRVLILAAAKRPRKRIRTRVPKAVKEKRLGDKRATAEKKRRRSTSYEE